MRLLSVRPQSSLGVLFGNTLYQDTLCRADHALTDRLRLLLQFFPAIVASRSSFISCGGAIRQIRGRRAGTRAVNEAEGAVEAHFLDKLHRGFEIGFGFAGKADDEIGGKRDVGPGGAQPAHDGFVFQRGVAALHRRQYAVRTRLHRQVQVADQLRQCSRRRRSAVR